MMTGGPVGAPVMMIESTSVTSMERFISLFYACIYYLCSFLIICVVLFTVSTLFHYLLYLNCIYLCMYACVYARDFSSMNVY